MLAQYHYTTEWYFGIKYLGSWYSEIKSILSGTLRYEYTGIVV